MRIRARRLLAGLTLGAGAALTAQAQAPLSAIDWLSQEAPPVIEWSVAPPGASALPAPRDIAEPPVSDGATVPSVETRPLGAPSVAGVGLLPQNVTGLPDDLWQASSAATLIRLMNETDPVGHPDMTALFATLLLAEATPPGGTGDGTALLAARIDALMDLGMVEAAEALVTRAGPDQPALFRRWFDLALLTGTEAEACAKLRSAPHLSDDVPSRVFCAARAQDWDLAANILQGAEALGTLDAATAELLWRFLDPELAETGMPLPPPRQPTPLVFRLYQALGEPIPTATLPRAFAVTDLSGDAGWKAQIEAAERLARAGAISENRLLGIYSERRRAASGGIWDRVEAIQRFDTALGVGDPGAIASALTRVWPQMQRTGLAAAFARLYGARLVDLPLSGDAARQAAQVALLSPDYEMVAATLPADMPDAAFLAQIARGLAPEAFPDAPLHDAVARGFGEDPAAVLPRDLREDLDRGKLGEVILRAIDLYLSGAEGNPNDLEAALATFRAVGLEDTARRAALHLLLTGPESQQ